MKQTYNLSRQLVAFILLISLLLQSCGGNNNLIVPIREKKGPYREQQLTPQIQTSIQPLVDQQLTANGGDAVTFYEYKGQVQASVQRLDEKNKVYNAIPVAIEERADLRSLTHLPKKVQAGRIHIQKASTGKPAKVVISKGLGLMGGMEGNKKDVSNQEYQKQEISRKDQDCSKDDDEYYDEDEYVDDEALFNEAVDTESPQDEKKTGDVVEKTEQKIQYQQESETTALKEEEKGDELKYDIRKLLKAAIRQEKSEAQFILGKRAYERWKQEGHKEEDYQEALYWLEQASGQEYPTAIDLLEELRQPSLTEINKVRSKEKGKQKAEENLAPEQEDKDNIKYDIRKLLEAAIRQKESEAQFTLGERAYERWKQKGHKEEDYQEALYWLKQASDQKDAAATALLEQLLPPKSEKDSKMSSNIGMGGNDKEEYNDDDFDEGFNDGSDEKENKGAEEQDKNIPITITQKPIEDTEELIIFQQARRSTIKHSKKREYIDREIVKKLNINQNEGKNSGKNSEEKKVERERRDTPSPIPFLTDHSNNKMGDRQGDTIKLKDVLEFPLDFLLFNFLSDWDQIDECTKDLRKQQAERYYKEAIEYRFNNIFSPEDRFLKAAQSSLRAIRLGLEAGMFYLGKLNSDANCFKTSFHWYNLALYTALLKTGEYPDCYLTSLQDLVKDSHPDEKKYVERLNEILPSVKQCLKVSYSVAERARQLLEFTMASGLSSYLDEDINLHFWTGLTILGHEPKIWPLDSLSPEEVRNRLHEFLKAKDEVDRLDQIEAKTKIYENHASIYSTLALPISLYELAILIEEEKVDSDEEGRPITSDKERNEAIARCYRQSQMPQALNNLGFLIEEGKTKFDAKGRLITSEIKKYEAAAYCYRRAKTYSALTNLGWLIKEHYIDHDEEENVIIYDEKRYEAAIRCYRMAGIYYDSILNEESQKEDNERKTEASRLNILGSLINQNKVNIDADGNVINSLDQRFEAAARCYRRAKSDNSQAFYNLGVLIEEGKINLDENEAPLDSLEKRYEAAARCYKKAKGISEAFYRLGKLVEEEKFNIDLRGNLISSQEIRYQVVAYYYKKAQTSQAFYDLSMLIFYNKLNKDNKGKDINSSLERKNAVIYYWEKSQEPETFYNLAIYNLCEDNTKSKRENIDIAKNYLMQAIGRGHDRALEIYGIIMRLENDKQEPDAILTTVRGQIFPEERFYPVDNINLNEEIASIPSPSVIGDKASSTNFMKGRGEEETKKMQKVKKRSISSRDQQVASTSRGEVRLSHVLKPTNTHSRLTIKWSKKARKQFYDLPPQELKKVHQLIAAIKAEDARTGRPKTLVGGEKSRRITKKGRLVYQDIEGGIEILSCARHYDD
ncbi:MAG: hypothetical protein ACYC2U_04515 [Candidatus Amoebophilus sp.]